MEVETAHLVSLLYPSISVPVQSRSRMLFFPHISLYRRDFHNQKHQAERNSKNRSKPPKTCKCSSATCRKCGCLALSTLLEKVKYSSKRTRMRGSSVTCYASSLASRSRLWRLVETPWMKMLCEWEIALLISDFKRRLSSHVDLDTPNPSTNSHSQVRYTNHNFACNPSAIATLSPTNLTTFLALPTEF